MNLSPKERIEQLREQQTKSSPGGITLFQGAAEKSAE